MKAKARLVLFWTVGIPAGLILLVLGLISVPMQAYRGCLYVIMELLEDFEAWCFWGPFGAPQKRDLWKTFMEGFET